MTFWGKILRKEDSPLDNDLVEVPEPQTNIAKYHYHKVFCIP